MPHAEIVNQTPFHVSPVFLADTEMRPVLVSLVRATYRIGADGSLTRHDEQIPPVLAGEFWGDPEKSSLKFEPECAYLKPATDVVMIGHAHAPHVGATEVQVGLRVGPVQKVVRVSGDRVMSRAWGGWSISPAQPFETMPLIYERAFGGWDRTHKDPSKHGFEARNPVGTGYRVAASDSSADVRMPNLEDPEALLTRPGDAPEPAGFGFVSAGWAQRRRWAGTYDAQWDKLRKPLLPEDFDMRFFNAASPGLIAPGYLAGDEPVVVVNASRSGRVAFHLPGVAAPVCECQFMGHRRGVLSTRLDTVVLDMDAQLLHLSWRGHGVLRNGPHDLVSMKVSSATHGAATSLQVA